MAKPLGALRRTKIVCTRGPASADEATIRAVEERVRAPVAILQDLQGPKIRLGTIRGGSATLREGAEFVISTRLEEEGSAARASTTYDGLARDVKAGDRLLVADGMIQLDVLQADGVEVRCRVVAGGVVSDHKGINLPGVDLDIPALTDKDQDDLAFGVKEVHPLLHAEG